jgi:hypothetical protein
MAVIISPYRKGMGPRLKIDLANGIMTAYEGKGKPPREVFWWNVADYKPGLGVQSDIQEADDVLSFANAYVERPEEFDRSRFDPEQMEKKWWEKHGEAMQAEANFRVEKLFGDR